MSTEVQKTPSTEELIAQLDPERDYGEERSYEDVVAGVRSGAILISPGQNLPVLYDYEKKRRVKGTGFDGGGGGGGPQQTALAQFRRAALDDIDEAYRELRAGMKKGDPRYHKIYWENLIGKVGEVRGGDAMVEAFKALIEAMKEPERREVVIDG